MRDLVSPSVPPAVLPKQEQHGGGTFTSSDSPDVWRPLLGYDLYDSTSNRNIYSSFAYACINKKALNLSKAKITLFKQFKSRKSEKETHPFLKLIHSTNSLGQSFKEILYLSSANCDLHGWAYVKINTLQTPFIELGKKGKTPVELIPLPAKMVTPVLDSQNSRIEYYRLNGKEKIVPEEIIRFKIPNPFSNLSPNPPIAAFNFTLDIEFLQSRARRSFFNNDARPTLAIEFPTKLPPAQFETYVEEFNKQHSGYRNNAKTMVVDNGAKVTTLNGNPRELDYVNSRNQVLDEIMLILDVNKQVMGDFTGSNYNNSRNALIGWIENTIMPYAEMCFNEPLTKFVNDYYDTSLVTFMEYDVNDPDFNLKLVDAKGLKLSQNEKRRLFNYDDYDDARAADIFYTEPIVRETVTAATTETPEQLEE